MTTVRTRTVDPAEILVPDVRVNAKMPADVAAAFAASVKDAGVLTPPLCIEQDGKLYVVDGRHRIGEAIAAGQKRIQVMVRQGTLQDVLLQNLATTHLTGRPDPREVLGVIEHLTVEEKLDSQEIAKRTGMPRDYIEGFQVIAQTGGPVREAFAVGDIGKNVALELAKVQDERIRLGLLEQAVQFSMTAQSVKEARKEAERLLKEPAASAAALISEPPKLTTCAMCDTAHESEAIRWNALCRACVAALPEIRKQLAAAAAVQP